MSCAVSIWCKACRGWRSFRIISCSFCTRNIVNVVLGVEWKMMFRSIWHCITKLCEPFKLSYYLVSPTIERFILCGLPFSILRSGSALYQLDTAYPDYSEGNLSDDMSMPPRYRKNRSRLMLSLSTEQSTEKTQTDLKECEPFLEASRWQ